MDFPTVFLLNFSYNLGTMPRTTCQSKSNEEDTEDDVLRLQKRAKELEEGAEVRYRVAFAERPRQSKSNNEDSEDDVLRLQKR